MPIVEPPEQGNGTNHQTRNDGAGVRVPDAPQTTTSATESTRARRFRKQEKQRREQQHSTTGLQRCLAHATPPE